MSIDGFPQPIIHDNLTQIFHKHYKMEPRAAAEAAMKFLEVLDLYKMQVIMGDWVVPEPILNGPTAPVDPWERALRSIQDIDASGREPWLAKEIQ